MMIRILGCLFLAVSLVGCASTSQQPSSVSHLQIKVSHLEKMIESRDNEISTLKYELSEIANQVESLETFQLDSGAEAYDAKESFMIEKMKRLEIAPASSKYDDILRVAVDPKKVQTALKGAGYYTGKIDGKLGVQSQKAIKEFQEDHDLKADGIIGKKTWGEMKAYLK